MPFLRRVVLATCIAGLLRAWIFPASLPAQPTAAPPAQTAQASPAGNEQAYTLPPDKLAKAVAYSRIGNILAIVGSIWGIVFLWLLLVTGGWGAIEEWAQSKIRSRWWQGVVFFFAFFILTMLASLPLDMIGQHYSRAFGISVQGWGSWFGDQAKGLGVALVVGTLVLMLFNRIVRAWPRRYWLGIWLVTLPLLVLAVFLSPLIIDPIFNKFEPLELHHAPLVAQLEKVVARTGIEIPPNRMYLMKASAKYNGINAYVTGIGASKRFVMWDTATDRLPDGEILFVFGHESGHYVLHHIPKILTGEAIGLFFDYWGCAAVAAWLVRRHGSKWRVTESGSRTGFVVLLFALSTAAFLLEPVNKRLQPAFRAPGRCLRAGGDSQHCSGPAENCGFALQSPRRSLAGRPQPQPVHRVLAIQSPERPVSSKFCRSLRSLGERRAWKVFSEVTRKQGNEGTRPVEDRFGCSPRSGRQKAAPRRKLQVSSSRISRSSRSRLENHSTLHQSQATSC